MASAKLWSFESVSKHVNKNSWHNTIFLTVSQPQGIWHMGVSSPVVVSLSAKITPLFNSQIAQSTVFLLLILHLNFERPQTALLEVFYIPQWKARKSHSLAQELIWSIVQQPKNEWQPFWEAVTVELKREKKVQSHFKSFKNLESNKKGTSKVGEKMAGDFFDPFMAADWKLGQN